jgi:hypothetical protein
LLLKAQYHGNDMSDVANGGQAEDADGVDQYGTLVIAGPDYWRVSGGPW